MYVILGSTSLAQSMANWLSKRGRCRLLWPAGSELGDIDLSGCEVVTFPSPCPLDKLPLPITTPTAFLLLQPELIAEDDPIAGLRQRWPKTRILTTQEVESSANHDAISVSQLTENAIRTRIQRWDARVSASALKQAIENTPETGRVTIFCHDNPDPDALASALAIQHLTKSLGRRATIHHGGLIEHQSNRTMVRRLNIDLERHILGWEVDDLLKNSDAIIAVDFHQPGANNILPAKCIPTVVIDHHAENNAPAADVKILKSEFGATSSLVATLFMGLDIEMNTEVATALACGIRADTLRFTRNFATVDLRALSWLHPWVDWDLLREIETPPRSRDTLEVFTEAFAQKKSFGRLLIAPLTRLPNRDALAQVADFLMDVEGVTTVITFGPRRGRVILSARSRNPAIHLGLTLGKAFPPGSAGGHKGLAGGQIAFADLVVNTAEADVEAKALAAMESKLLDMFGE